MSDDFLRHWRTAEPPPDFAARTLAAARPRRRVAPWGLLAASLCVVVAGGLALRARTSHGHVEAVTRVQATLADRAVVVAEQGSELDWLVAGRDGHVSQSIGDVFYRVEPGGRFQVTTPFGVVAALGTCFRLEITSMPSSRVGPAVVGALVGGLVVSVYEGRVQVQTDRGVVEAGPGEQVRVLGRDTAPTVSAMRGATSLPTSSAGPNGASSPAGPSNESREQLAARAEALSQRVDELERALLATRTTPEQQRPEKEKFHDFSKEELLEMARECRLPYATPQMGRDPFRLKPEKGAEFKLSDEEQRRAEAAVNAVAGPAVERIRALYIEATGDRLGADSLEVGTMGAEILSKGGGEDALARARITKELAGLAPPPADLSKTSAQERYLRLMFGLGGAIEHELEKSFSPRVASSLREAFTTHHSVHGGCPE